MKEDKLIRGDAKLKKLPEERQREIWDKLNTPGETLKSVAKWLSDDGLRVSHETVRQFWDWYSFKLTFGQAESNTLNFQEFVAQSMPALSKEQVKELGSIFFQTEAIKNRDSKLLLEWQTAEHNAEMDHKKFDQKERELMLSQQKFQRETCELFLKWFDSKQAREIAASAESNATKIEKLGQAMFGELWGSAAPGQSK